MVRGGSCRGFISAYTPILENVCAKLRSQAAVCVSVRANASRVVCSCLLACGSADKVVYSERVRTNGSSDPRWSFGAPITFVSPCGSLGDLSG